MKAKRGLISTLFSYVGDIVYLLLHIALFYILPIKAELDDSNKIVVIQFFLTFALGLLMGGLIRKGDKFLYPFVATLVYLPSVFVHFTKEQISYCLWIFIASFLGVIIGQIVLKPKPLPKKESNKEKKIDEKKARKKAESDKAAIEALDSYNEMKKLGNTIPAEFDITDSDVVPDVKTPVRESFGKRFLASLKRRFDENKKEKQQKKTKKAKDKQD